MIGRKQWLRICAAFVVGGVWLLATTVTRADEVNRLTHALGVAHVSNDSFEDAGALLLEYSFVGSPVEFSLGGFAIATFETEEGDGELEIGGGYLSVGKQIDMGDVFLVLQGGIAYTSTEAYVLDQKIGEDDDTNAMGRISLGYQFTDFLGAQAGMLYLNDVSGEDISILNIGLSWSF